MVPSFATSYGSSSQVDVAVPEQFPVGLRVLVVDDDSSCLRILETMLRRCLYNATVALNLLRKKKGCFDVVMSDVHMPNVDGYKLLEHIRLEIDLPVIMISTDERVTAVMKGIRYGACDYLIKPICEEELKNIWQHVIRRKWNRNKEIEHSGTKRVLKYQKKRICTKEEDDGKLGNEDPSTKKKPRIIWSVELHQKFVSAVD
ncbi:Two-component response regulator [Melia azedarach]|uniref:Two-component response regulator n=1 Tax=Melia azedarach TaxID=155640 RepID=A0ACC1XUZ2_MELAZ|nr:Two-component response regulator [Melia azedarach]